MQADVPQISNLAILQNEVSARYGLTSMGEWTRIINGDECLVWKVENGDFPLIVRLSPAWRTLDELRWTHRLTVHCGKTIAEVIAPQSARDDSTLFVHEGYPVTVFPFVEGDSLNDAQPDLCNKAAALLAKIHLAAHNWSDKSPRPASKNIRPQALARAEYPPMLQDADFDAWEDSLPTLGLTIAPIHGDYYCRNVLATATTITGVIDWDEANLTYLMAEVSWSAWEFSQNATGDDIVDTRAREFFAAYFAEKPPCPQIEMQHAANFIRLRLRNEAATDLARKARGEYWDKEYTEGEMRAFVALKGRMI